VPLLLPTAHTAVRARLDHWFEQRAIRPRIGPCEGVTEHFFAIGTEKKVQHPLVQCLLQPAI
jgi:LysR family transcriptional activator of nhaA